jgi:hypothetical protein
LIRQIALIVAVVVALAAGVWFFYAPADTTSAVKERLESFSEMVNRSTVDGLGPEARAAQLGAFLTEDVDVDLGQGTAPIRGRDTVVGMAARLQPRTAAFRLKFEDVSVVMSPDGNNADVHLTAEFIRRSIATGEESLDAREFMLVMRRVADDWQIAKATAIQTLK